MKKLYFSCSKHIAAALFSFAFLLAVGTAAAQATPPCGIIVEDFNIQSNGMAGFTSTRLFSDAPGFEYSFNGTDGYLQVCNIPNAGTTIQIVSATFNSLASQAFSGYGFVLDNVPVSDISVYFQYVDANNYVNTIKDFTTSITRSGNTTIVCDSMLFTTINNFTPGDAYRFVIDLTAAQATTAGNCLTFDNFRTNGGPSNIILPVSFTGLSASKVSGGVEVVWNVAGEKEVSRYEVERSTNGTQFSAIGSVNAAGKSAYRFVDQHPVSGTSFYRVKNIDIDGKAQYSTIFKMSSQSLSLRFYPQPAHTRVFINHERLPVKGYITISNTNGQVVRQLQVQPGSEQTTVDVSQLHPGMYLLRFSNGQGGVETLKILKK